MRLKINKTEWTKEKVQKYEEQMDAMEDRYRKMDEDVYGKPFKANSIHESPLSIDIFSGTNLSHSSRFIFTEGLDRYIDLENLVTDSPEACIFFEEQEVLCFRVYFCDLTNEIENYNISVIFYSKENIISSLRTLGEKKEIYLTIDDLKKIDYIKIEYMN